MYRSAAYPRVEWDAIMRFIAENFQGKCVGVNSEGYPESSVLPYEFHGPTKDAPLGWFDLHLVQADPTFVALQQHAPCAFIIDQPLAFSPHYLVDPDYAGYATLHFRAAHFYCRATTSTNVESVASVLDNLVRSYEPGTPFHPVTDHAFYKDDLARLGIAHLVITAWDAKFKMAQNRSPEEQARLKAFLKNRGQALDKLAVEELQREWERLHSGDS